MDENLTSQQQAEQVKGWVRSNGVFVVAGVVLGLCALFGWNQWKAYKVRQAEAASVEYEALMVAVRANNFEQAGTELDALVNGYRGSPYVDQGRFALARMNLDRSKPDEAVILLRQVVDGASSPEFREIARLRLARVLAFQEKYEEALKALDDQKPGAFAPGFHDVRGDIYTAMGKDAEARSEYEQALNADTGTTLINREFVQAKLDELGGPVAAIRPAAATGQPEAAAAAATPSPASPGAPAP